VKPPAFESIRFVTSTAAARLIVTGGVHGNEPCGTTAIRRVLDDIYLERLSIVAGEVTFVPVANPLARARAQREGDRDLNRRLKPTNDPREFEDHVANWLCPMLQQHDVLLDLHSFQAPGEPFVMLGPVNNSGGLEPFGHAEREEALATRLGVRRIVDGWFGTYAQGVERRSARAPAGSVSDDRDALSGTGTTEYMRRVGGWALTVECGQHLDDRTAEVGYQAILNALAHLGLIDAPDPQRVSDIEALRLFRVFDKEHLGDRFSRAWKSFDRVGAGTEIATRQDGTRLNAEIDCHVVFPDINAEPGQEWFYLARPHERLTQKA
jgi:predicted deacylase